MPQAERNTPPEEELHPDDEHEQEVTDAGDDDGEEVTEGEGAGKKKPSATSDSDFENLSPREKALVQKARAQEKQKLYNDLKVLRAKVRELERVKPAPSTEEEPRRRGGKKDDDGAEPGEDLRAEIRALREEITARERRAEIRAYRAEKIAEARRDGSRIIESLVVGDSEDDIDAAVEVAKAEAEFIYAEAEANLAAQGGKTRTHHVRDGAPRRPAGVAPTVTGAGSGDESSGYSLEEIKELTSMESLRDGTWAQKRKQVLQALRQGHIRQ